LKRKKKPWPKRARRIGKRKRGKTKGGEYSQGKRSAVGEKKKALRTPRGGKGEGGKNKRPGNLKKREWKRASLGKKGLKKRGEDQKSPLKFAGGKKLGEKALRKKENAAFLS